MPWTLTGGTAALNPVEGSLCLLCLLKPPPQLSGQTAAPFPRTTRPARHLVIFVGLQPFLSKVSHIPYRSAKPFGCEYAPPSTSTSFPDLTRRAAHIQETRQHGRIYLQIFWVDLGEEGNQDTDSWACRSCPCDRECVWTDHRRRTTPARRRCCTD